MSNMAKSLNSCLWQTRKLAIITLVEKTRTKLVSVFFFQVQGRRSSHDCFSDVAGAFGAPRVRGQILPNDGPGVLRALLFSPYPCTYVVWRWSRRTCSAGDGKSQVFHVPMRLRSSETESYREKHIAIRTSTLKISGSRIRKFSSQLSMLTRALSLLWKLS